MPSDIPNGGDPAAYDQQPPATIGAPVTSGYTAVTPVQPPPAPAKSGPSALKIILIVVVIFVGLGILGAAAVGFTIWRVAHAVHVSGPNGEVTVNTPGGTITANSDESYTAADLGTNVYPGAVSTKGGMKMSMPTGTSVTAIFLTPGLQGPGAELLQEQVRQQRHVHGLRHYRASHRKEEQR